MCAEKSDQSPDNAARVGNHIIEFLTGVSGIEIACSSEAVSFHWIKEISRYQSVSRKRQSQARTLLVKAIADDLACEQIDHLVIESGVRSTDASDKAALLGEGPVYTN